jgi:hypothetical protein
VILARTQLADGLYAVIIDRPDGSPWLCAGFIVTDGYVTDCAPILRRNIERNINSGYVRRVGP